MLQSNGNFCVCDDEDTRIPTEVMVTQDGTAVDVMMGVGLEDKGNMYSVGYFWRGKFYLNNIPADIAEALGLKITKSGFMQIERHTA
ncbi:hypothetical protein LCGC14_1286400 [marine sediment metagenome]|uniref:Uncharacterized protein n=1 Tax=marine sediment metagenome TaxID=412755 RepID=A0A0F9KVE8_9ZZZZ